MIFITAGTPPSVAHAQIRAWQQDKEQTLMAALEIAIAKAVGGGLERTRIVKALSIMAEGVEKAGGQ